MIEKNDCTAIGKLAKTHGIHGEISLLLDSGHLWSDISTAFLLVDIDNGLVPFYIENQRLKNETHIFVKLSDVNTEIQARALSNSFVYVKSNEISAPEKQFSPQMLIGYSAIREGDIKVGTITDYQNIPSNPLFEIDINEQKVLLPFNMDFILGVDHDKKEIVFSFPDGLLDLYLNDND